MAERLKLISAPSEEPLTRAETKTYLRVDTDITEDDDLIDGLIEGARNYAEMYTGRALVTQTWTWYLDCFPRKRNWIRLPKSPNQSVSSIKYYDTNGDLQTWDSSKYVVDESDTVPARITLAESESWPDTRSQANSLEITFVGGYGAATAVPRAIRTAMLMMIAHWYENREAVTLEGDPKEVPLAAESLLWSKRSLLSTDTGDDD